MIGGAKDSMMHAVKRQAREHDTYIVCECVCLLYKNRIEKKLTHPSMSNSFDDDELNEFHADEASGSSLRDEPSDFNAAMLYASHEGYRRDDESGGSHSKDTLFDTVQQIIVDARTVNEELRWLSTRNNETTRCPPNNKTVVSSIKETQKLVKVITRLREAAQRYMPWRLAPRDR